MMTAFVPSLGSAPGSRRCSLHGRPVQRSRWSVTHAQGPQTKRSTILCAVSSGPAYTYYEGNSWNLKVGEENVLVDPIASDMTFFSSAVYNQKKNIFSRDNKKPSAVLPQPSLILITQSLSDHLHLPTLRQFNRKTRIVTTQKAAEMLRLEGFRNVIALKYGHSSEELNGELNVLATAGPTLGPPWQLPENGYLLILKSSGLKIYYEPHSVPADGGLKGLSADIAVMAWDRSIFKPLNYTLVSGEEGAIKVAKQLQVSKIFVINNKTLSSTGVLKGFLDVSGSPKAFEAAMRRNGIKAEVVVPEPTKAYPLSSVQSLYTSNR